MNENKIIETLKYISQFVKNGHDEGLGDYLHIVIGRTDINVIDETIHLLERKQKEIEKLKEKNTQLTNYLNDSYYVSADQIREILKDLDEFDDYFFNVSTLKEAIKNSLNRLLEEN